MPRQDVPYGGAICRLKERIAEIFDKLGEKLHTINGVPGDGDGNVQIVSGDAAITISESQPGHYVEIGLDHGNLPSAAVSSVNGQTGAVALDAGDIPSDGNSDVQSDIDALQTMDGALQGNINAEALARQNADSALQTNINAEALTRSSTDTNLQNQINTLPTNTDVTQAVQDGLDNYATMVRTANAQTIGGVKTFTSPPVVIAPKTAGIPLSMGYYKIAKFGVSPRWYAVGLLATRGASTAIASVTGSLNGGVWTTSTTSQVVGATAERLKIGVCTLNGENILVAHITSSTALNILILGSTSGSSTVLDSMSVVTPESITPGTDYVEGDYVI